MSKNTAVKATEGQTIKDWKTMQHFEVLLVNPGNVAWCRSIATGEEKAVCLDRADIVDKPTTAEQWLSQYVDSPMPLLRILRNEVAAAEYICIWQDEEGDAIEYKCGTKHDTRVIHAGKSNTAELACWWPRDYTLKQIDQFAAKDTPKHRNCSKCGQVLTDVWTEQSTGECELCLNTGIGPIVKSV